MFIAASSTPVGLVSVAGAGVEVEADATGAVLPDPTGTAEAIGVLATFVAVIVGEVAMAVAIDQFGWFHTSRVAFTWERGLGVVLLGLSLVLILRRS